VTRSPAGGPGTLDTEGALLAVFGALCGASVWGFGFYDASLWGPAALVALAVLFGLGLVRRAWPPRLGGLALAGLLALALWSALSRGWAESPDGALVAAERWLLYGIVFAALLLMLRDRRHATMLLGGATASVVAVGLYLVARLVLGDGPSLFVARRLTFPLGYTNAQGGFLLLGFWPLVALAERSRSLLWGSLAVGTATLLAGLMVLSQARGVAFAFVASAGVLLVLVPGRRARLWVLIAVLAGVALVIDPAVDVYGHAAPGRPPAGAVRDAGERIVLAAAMVGLLWGGALALLQALPQQDPTVGKTLNALSAGALILLALVAGGVAVTNADTISHHIRRQSDAFFHLRGGSTGNRFLTGSGNRYDYWRIAVKEFRDRPLDGQGAGSYAPTYYLERRTTENIRQPHSIELQALAELGVVGAGALLLFLGPIAFGFARMALAGRLDAWARAAAVGAGGTFVAWLAHTSVDWLHLIPGLTAIALGAAAILCAPWTAPQRRIEVSRRGAAVLVAAYAVAIGLAAFAIGRSVLAKHHRAEAQKAARSDPAHALDEANASLDLNDDALPTYYVKAAALAKLHSYEGARDTLLAAARREPRAFVTWALLGDIAVRRGDFAVARRYYRRASRLNPRDEALAKLSRNPRAATRAP
jgi:tetratricopeptide (TPR) repeat protein